MPEPARLRGRSGHEFVFAIYPSAGSDDAANGGDCDCGSNCFHGAAGIAVAAGGFSDDLRECESAGRKRGSYGLGGGDAAGTAVWTYCRGDEVDPFEQPRLAID